MARVLDYASLSDKPRCGWIDLVFVVLVALCFGGAIADLILMPSSPHREDPDVIWAIFFAQISAATAALLFVWGAIRIVLLRELGTPRLVRIAWKACGVLVLAILFLGHPFGPGLYR